MKADTEFRVILKKLSKHNWRFNKSKLYSFWNKLLFSKGKFTGNPFQYPIPIFIEKQTFENFESKLSGIIDENFEGENAAFVKSRINALSSLYQNKLKYTKPSQQVKT